MYPNKELVLLQKNSEYDSHTFKKSCTVFTNSLMLHMTIQFGKVPLGEYGLHMFACIRPFKMDEWLDGTANCDWIH